MLLFLFLLISELCLLKQALNKKEAKNFPVRGLEPRYPAWKASMLTTYIIPERVLDLNFIEVQITWVCFSNSYTSWISHFAYFVLFRLIRCGLRLPWRCGLCKRARRARALSGRALGLANQITPLACLVRRALGCLDKIARRPCSPAILLRTVKYLYGL